MARNWEITFAREDWYAGDVAPARGAYSSTRRPYVPFDDSGLTHAELVSRVFAIPAGYINRALHFDLAHRFQEHFHPSYFDVEIEAISPGDAVDMNAADQFGTANQYSLLNLPDDWGDAGSVHSLRTTTFDFTPGITLEAGDLCRLRLTRRTDIDPSASPPIVMHYLTLYEGT